MIENLLSFAAGAVIGGAVVAIFARNIIQTIRRDWQTANAVRGRSQR